MAVVDVASSPASFMTSALFALPAVNASSRHVDLRNASAQLIYDQSVMLRGSGGRKTANRCFSHVPPQQNRCRQQRAYATARHLDHAFPATAPFCSMWRSHVACSRNIPASVSRVMRRTSDYWSKAGACHDAGWCVYLRQCTAPCRVKKRQISSQPTAQGVWKPTLDLGNRLKWLNGSPKVSPQQAQPVRAPSTASVPASEAAAEAVSA